MGLSQDSGLGLFFRLLQLPLSRHIPNCEMGRVPSCCWYGIIAVFLPKELDTRRLSLPRGPFPVAGT